MTTIGETLSKRNPDNSDWLSAKQMAVLPDQLQIRDETLVGIEVEVESAGTNRSLSGVWQIMEDNSLRNGGREFVTVPIKAKYAGWALDDLLGGGLDKDQCAFTMRTSVHVHINMLDVTSEQLKNMLLLYLVFERNLYRYVGRTRWKNVFCVPVLDTDYYQKILERPWHKLTWEKYLGLNLKRLTDYGTIEFRHMAGTFDVQKIVQWIRIILAMRKYAVATEHPRLLEIIRHLSSEDIPALGREVFGEYWFNVDNTETKEYLEVIPLVKGVFGPISKNLQYLSSYLYSEKAEVEMRSKQKEKI